MKETKHLIGTSGWTYPDWKNVFYPEKLPMSKWLEYYASVFPTVEVNATFYRWFKDPTFHKWRERVPAAFEYVLKAPKLITHWKHLLDADESIRSFWKSACLLEGKFGLILLQLAPNTPYDPDRLKKALLSFGDPTKIAVEFRNDKWLTDETRTLLNSLHVVFCNSDSPRSRLAGWVTSNIGYLRLHGRRRWYADEYTDNELEEIAAHAETLANQGAQKIYIFFNNDVCGYAVHNARKLMEMLK